MPSGCPMLLWPLRNDSSAQHGERWPPVNRHRAALIGACEDAAYFDALTAQRQDDGTVTSEFICPYCFRPYSSEHPSCPSCGKSSPLPANEPISEPRPEGDEFKYGCTGALLTQGALLGPLGIFLLPLFPVAIVIDLLQLALWAGQRLRGGPGPSKNPESPDDRGNVDHGPF